MHSRIYLHLTRKRIRILRKKRLAKSLNLFFAMQIKARDVAQLKHKCAFCFMTKYVNTTTIVSFPFIITNAKMMKKEPGKKVTRRRFHFVSLKSHKSTSV